MTVQLRAKRQPVPSSSHREVVVVLLGRPGSGKGTQAQFLADSGWSHLNVGGLIRSEVAAGTSWGRYATTVMLRGDLLPSSEIQNLINRSYDQSKLPLVVEGYPRRVHEARTLPDLFGATTIRIPVFLDLPRAVSVSRLTTRLVCQACGHVTREGTSPTCPRCAGPLTSRADDRLAGAVRRRQALFESQTLPLIAFYRQRGELELIDATQDEAVIHSDMLHRIEARCRRIWADSIGRRDEWDWAAFPFMANTRLTATALRSTGQPATAEASLREAEVTETLTAYEVAADSYAAKTREFNGNSSLKAELDSLAAHTTGDLLDADAGAGRDAWYLAGLGRQVMALDASPGLLRRIAPHPCIRKIVGDVRKIPLDDASVGGVWCSAVLLHLDPAGVQRALREFARVMRPGGLAQVSVKEGRGHESTPMAGFPGYRRHFYYYQAHELRHFGRLAGLRVVRDWSDDEADSSTTVQRWVKVLLRKPWS